MIRLEMRRVLQEGAVLLVVMTGLTLGILFSRRGGNLAPVLEIFLLLYASFTGWALLDRERQDGALETLLSLPVSRLRLLGLKVLPRMLFLAAVLALYAGLNRIGHFHSYLPPLELALLAGSFFLTSLSLSVSLKSFFGAGSVTVLLIFGLTALLKWLDPVLGDGPAIMQAIVPLLSLPLVFALCFRRLDVRPVSHFNRRFLPAALVCVAVGAAALYAMNAVHWGCHFLLADGGVVRSNCDLCRFSDWIRGAERRRFPGCVHVLRQFRGHDYADWRVKEKDGWHSWLTEFDFAAGRARKLYEVDSEAGWYFGEGRFMELGATCGSAWYVPLQNLRSGEFRILEVTAAGVRPLPLRLQSDRRESIFLFHALGDPLRFLLHSGRQVRLVPAAGPATTLGEADNVSAWKNRLLLIDRRGMRLIDLSGDPFTVLARDGRARKMGVSWAPVEQPAALVRLGGQVFQVDLESAGLRPVSSRISPHYFFCRGNSLWLVERPRYDQLALRRLVDGKVVEERRFAVAIQSPLFRTFPGGVMLSNRKVYEAYRFPE